MFKLKRKTINNLAILAICLVGIFSPSEYLVGSDGGRKLQAISGSTRAESGLSDAEWIEFTTVVSQPGCKFENNCNQCRGICANDDHCIGTLRCLIREEKTDLVPGCIVSDDGFDGPVCYNPDSDYFPPGPPLPNPLTTSYNPMCTADAPCDVCGGMCDLGSDDQCTGDLRCSYFTNSWPTGKNNCNYNGVSSKTKGYCMPAEDFQAPASNVALSSADWDPTVPDRGELIIVPECPAEGCPVCTAPMNNWLGCTSDTACAADLTCYDHHEKTDTNKQQVSGCSSNKIWKFGYCYTKDMIYQPPAILHLTEARHEADVALTNVVSAPEECAIYASDPNNLVDIPFGGTSDVGLKASLFHKVTYIYVVDASKSTKTYMATLECGDANSDNAAKHVIDCEILAVQTVNDAANAGGNVDLVGLVQFNNVAATLQTLTQPWARLSPDRRDAAVVELARRIAPNEATNFEAGVEEACKMARDPVNDNAQTVVIFLSDGAPNLGTTSRDTLTNNCGNAIFHTYAVTEAADCDIVDEANLRPGIDSPDTLREIATFSGGTCTQVPDVSKLPDLLVQLEKTTWDGVTVKVNGVPNRNANVVYSKEPSFDAPGSVTYSGSVPLGPGEHTVCMEARSSTSGVVDFATTCKTVVVESIQVSPDRQMVDEGASAPFTVRFVGLKPDCDTFANKVVTVELFDGSKQITTTQTDASGSVTVTVPAEPGVTETRYKVCHTAANGSQSCTTTTVEYMQPPTEPPTESPVETQPPVDAMPRDAGVNGDPLIMGLSGQLFKFDGRNGAWYSAVSTPSFQWNMKINNYETCPNHSNTFVAGAGFTFFKNGKTTSRIEANVVNAHNVDVGCGRDDLQNCLGFGSLELMIDGVKHVFGGDYKTNDGLIRITAFNTFYQCSRKWYDFDVRPNTSLRTGRSLADEEPVFDLISGLKNTMIDQEECQKWINDRQAYSDLFMQPGRYSTVIIKTADIALHLEYKQESERCNAHTINVWISSVSPTLLEQKWEGIIGETKDINYHPSGKDSLMIDRRVALKFPEDKDYEVNSPSSTRCKGCDRK